MAEATNNPNHSLDRRREEKAAEQLMQDNTHRLTDLTACQMEIWQKYMNYNASLANYWADSFNGIQQAMGNMINTAQKTVEQNRRSS